MTLNKINLDSFVSSYLQTALWVTVDSSEEECTDFTKEAIQTAKNDCQAFIDRVVKALGEDKANELLTIPGNDLDYLAPHCFFLNRNGHGTGFWDRENEFGEYADLLSDISHEMKECDVMHVRGKKSKLTFY